MVDLYDPVKILWLVGPFPTEEKAREYHDGAKGTRVNPDSIHLPVPLWDPADWERAYNEDLLE